MGAIVGSSHAEPEEVRLEVYGLLRRCLAWVWRVQIPSEGGMTGGAWDTCLYRPQPRHVVHPPRTATSFDHVQAVGVGLVGRHVVCQARPVEGRSVCGTVPFGTQLRAKPAKLHA